ncbi:hypothetical protein PSQ40_12380 [Curvibacter sp. HBC61]|uniref:Lipoprotein transmembrane n=1 Tax=Curvibacter cyanobacteriorum TaxID=3026422 RepID=A0ABT5MZ68_9BURK|nr:hypothetical protein [Curvibacter sp. HBC61]MDD0839373.1 hypothetical protein [Curvibacter sp. HBC61]
MRARAAAPARTGRLAATVVLAGLLAACAGSPVFNFPSAQPLGSTRAELLARLGPPTARYPLPSGERLQYSYLPAGTAVYNLDLDAQGRLQRVDQPLRKQRLDAELQLGQTRADDLRLAYGAPARIDRVARFEGQVWVYQFLDLNEAFYAYLHLDPDGVLRRVVYQQVRDPAERLSR